MKCISAFALAALWLAAGLDCSPVGNNTASTSCLPVVDLGYVRFIYYRPGHELAPY